MAGAFLVVSLRHMAFDAEAEYDTRAAKDRQRDILADVQGIRNTLTKEIIDYYWDRTPSSDRNEEENRSGIRKYLRVALSEIEDLLNGPLR